MTKLTDQDRDFIRLILRSTDSGEGWRNVNPALWSWVDRFPHADLIEKDAEQKRVRLSPEGVIVAKWLT